MKVRHAALLVFAAAVTLSSVASAGSEAAKQLVQITYKGVSSPASVGKFELLPLSPGALEPDSGTEAAVVANQRVVTRDGETAQIVTWVSTCKSMSTPGTVFTSAPVPGDSSVGRACTQGPQEAAGSQTPGSTSDPMPSASAAEAS